MSPETKLRITLVQANPTVGAIGANLEIVRRYRRQFTGKADLLVFSECFGTGYATLYGDMCGGYSVLKDVYKTTVFTLARWRNAHRPDGLLGPEAMVVPERIIGKPPSAELKADQTDEAALGAYEHLDAVLRHLVEGMNDAPRAAALASAELGTPIDVAYAERIGRLVWHAEYKRHQGPMGIVLSGRGYDKGWRLRVTNEYGL